MTGELIAPEYIVVPSYVADLIEEVLMPYKSRAQEAWAHTPEGMKALGGPGKVAEWDSATKGMKLPERKAPSGGILGNVKPPRKKSGWK